MSRAKSALSEPTEIPDAAFSPALTAHGRLHLTGAEGAPALSEDVALRLRAAFGRGAGHGLLQLGAGEVGTTLPAVFSYWRELGSLFVTALCTTAEDDKTPAVSLPPPREELLALADAAPPMTGAEYLTASVLESLWEEMAAAFRDERRRSGLGTQELLKRWSPAWNLVGRVHFNLAENRKDEDAPFAFLATYTSRLSAHGKAQHLPLGQALREYSGEARRDRLLSLLLPVQRAATTCSWLKTMVDTGEIFHPLRFTPREAFQLLNDLPRLEAAGVVLRMPASWRGLRPARPRVTATVGGKPPSGLGASALLDFRLHIALDGEPLGEDEIAHLLASTDGLALVRGQWVEVDPHRLRLTLDELKRVEREARTNGVSFAEALRMLAGARVGGESDGAAADPDWSRVVAGPWLARTLEGLRRPEGLAHVEPGEALRATLRPYQQAGVRWLYLLYKLGLGACLADDMGLGKTIQMLALLAVLKREAGKGRRPSLLVAPASLLANWALETSRFAPDLRVLVAHSSVLPAEDLKELVARAARRHRPPGHELRLAAAAPLARDRALRPRHPRRGAGHQEPRRPADQGGEAAQRPGAGRPHGHARREPPLRPLVDLRLREPGPPRLGPGVRGLHEAPRGEAAPPVRAAAGAGAALRPPPAQDRPLGDRRPAGQDRGQGLLHAPPQAGRALCGGGAELADRIAGTEGIARKGLILAFLTRFKQICNHPSHWLGDAGWAEADSGKLARLREIAEVLAARQEKVLVFTQFREATGPLAAHLGSVFGRPGLVLHGDTPVKKRPEIVKRFQEDEAVPFFVLSLKAGGAGLNLTAASHVVHFDRWWNPAVENQATDRAFRIGQVKNVLVHKFVCRGTVEEKIDALIESKQQLSRDVLEGGAERLLTEMKDDEILDLVALDLRAATAGE